MLATGDGQGSATVVLNGGIDIFRYQRAAGNTNRAGVFDAEAVASSAPRSVKVPPCMAKLLSCAICKPLAALVAVTVPLIMVMLAPNSA